MAADATAEKYSVPALARAFEILDILSMSSVGLTKMDVARQVEIPYSTAFNLLNTMEQYGYVRKDQGTGRYYLGLKLLSLGSIQIRDVNLRDLAAPALVELVRRTGLTAHLAILDRGEAIYIDKKEPEGFLKINSWIGKRNYIHTSAVGKALVADMNSSEVQQIWEAGLPKRTSNTVNTWKKFKAELATVRTIGYAIDKEEDEIGGRCIAAPIFDASGARAAAIGLSGIVSQVPDERIPVLGEMVRSAADVISTRLGYQATKQHSHENHRVAMPVSSKISSRA